MISQGIGYSVERVLRLAGTMVLARLLTPADFGLVGVVMIVITALESLTYFAFEQLIVYSDRAREKTFLSTLFWIGAARGIFIGAAIAATAPIVANYFGYSEATPLFTTVALISVLTGLSNPRANLLQKDLRFGLWNLYRIVGIVIGLGASIILAVKMRNAWALVIGQCVTQAALTVIGYMVVPFRPQFIFDIKSWREIRQFAIQAAGTPILLTLAMQAPAVILGRKGDAVILGVFLMNYRLASIPTEFALSVIGRVATPAYSSIKDQHQRLASAWLTALRSITMVTLPLAVILAWIGAALPELVYGPTYRGDPSLFPVLSITSALFATIAVTGPLFWGVGRPSYDRNIQLIRVLLIYAVSWLLVDEYGAIGIAVAMLVAGFVGCFASLVFVRKIIRLSWTILARNTLGSALVSTLTVSIVLVAINVFAYPDSALRVAIGVALAIACVGLSISWLLPRLNASRNLQPPKLYAHIRS